MNDKASVFISYTSSEADYARALAEELDSLGIKSWTHASARATRTIEKQIRDALTAASWFVVLVSDMSLASAWISFELGAAIGQGKRVIPVYLSNSARRRASQPFKQLHSVTVAGDSPVQAARKVARMILSQDENALGNSKRAS
jgi:TIR domain